MKARSLMLAAICMIAVAARSGPVDSLERLVEFVARHYCCRKAITSRDITFSAPLTGAPVTFLHFLWNVKTFDESGRLQRDDLSGLVRYTPSGDLEELEVTGRLTSEEPLRTLRKQMKRTKRWPTRPPTLPFGPTADPTTLAKRVVGSLNSLVDKDLVFVSGEFRTFRRSDGEPDATWYLTFRTRDAAVAVVKARLEPFTGTFIQLNICAAGDC
jgi:hypothetical protein